MTQDHTPTERRRAPHHPARVRVESGGRSIDCALIRLTVAGARLRTDVPLGDDDSPCDLVIDGVGRFPARIDGADGRKASVRFETASPENWARIKRLARDLA